MAIKKTIQSPYGFTADECYIVIEGINYEKNGLSMIYMFAYKSEADRDAGFSPFKNINYAVTIDISSSDNFLTQAYNQIKALPEFIGSTDA
jgi:hypothetical protein